jgi:hypothetical protein
MTGRPSLGTVVFMNGLPLLLHTLFVTPALAQGIPSPAPLAPPGTSSPAAGGSGALIVLGVFVALLVVIGVIAKVSDVQRRREAEGLGLQARLGDVLLMDPMLHGAAITPTVHVPMRQGSPVRIEITGSVPSPEMRDRALHVMRQEATRFTQYALDVEIEDRVSVLPSVAIRQAA